MIRKRDARVLTVHTVASDTIVGECFFAIRPVLRRVRDGILLFFIADKQMMLGKDNRLAFQLARRAGGFASSQPRRAEGDDEPSTAAHH